jgi:DNA-binding MarR family transcriptional regulator
MPRAFYKVEEFSSKNSLGYLSRRLHNLLQPRAEAAFADAELTFSQWVALMALREGVVSTCADVARHLNHDTGATTRMIDQLEARGFLTRSRSKSDRRLVNLALTPQGRATARALASRLVDFWNEVLQDFTQSEASGLIALLSKLADSVEGIPIPQLPEKKLQGAR